MRIFISYRRDDSGYISGRIYSRLAEEFGADAVIMDVDIPLGVDYEAYLANVVAECAVEIVIIGPDWLTITNEAGKRRLEAPDDLVRIEVEAALSRDIPVIPVVVRGASVPKADQLPPGIAKMAKRNGIPVRRDPDFDSDMERLIGGLEAYVPRKVKPVERTGAPPPDAHPGGEAAARPRRRPRIGKIVGVSFFGLASAIASLVTLLILQYESPGEAFFPAVLALISIVATLVILFR